MVWCVGRVAETRLKFRSSPLRPTPSDRDRSECVPRLLRPSPEIYHPPNPRTPSHPAVRFVRLRLCAAKTIYIYITHTHTRKHILFIRRCYAYKRARKCVCEMETSGQGWMKYLTCGRRQNRVHS